jgi:hypothetical protein
MGIADEITSGKVQPASRQTTEEDNRQMLSRPTPAFGRSA